MQEGNEVRRWRRWLPIVFFILGFTFDALILRRPDAPLVIAHQAVYLLLAAGLVAIELREKRGELSPPTVLLKVWRYRESALHFLLGTLLNAYTIFFFKSASAFSSFLLVAGLGAILVVNEFKHFGRFQTQVHVALLSLCVICYFANLAPLVLGFIGLLPFLCANGVALGVILVFRSLVASRLRISSELLRTHLLVPYLVVQTVFVVLYIARVLPPVPLSAAYMGVFHNVARTDGGAYQLTYTREREFFWQRGDQVFLARAGDSVFCFVRIYAPSGFKDELQVRWSYEDPINGWVAYDAIPFEIRGGREAGFRGFTKKSNYQPGRWRVQVETKDNREIGRITFRIENDSSGEPREEKYLID